MTYAHLSAPTPPSASRGEDMGRAGFGRRGAEPGVLKVGALTVSREKKGHPMIVFPSLVKDMKYRFDAETSRMEGVSGGATRPRLVLLK